MYFDKEYSVMLYLNYSRIYLSISIIVHVDTCPTQRRISFVLFHGRFCPSPKRLEITKRLSIVIMGIPQRLAGHIFTPVPAAHNSLPHRTRAINAHRLPISLDRTDQFLDIPTVTGRRIPTPRASRAWICFHIQPHHPIKATIDCRHHLVYLGCGVFAPAGEHIHVDILDAGGTGVFEVGHRVAVDCSGGFVATDNHETSALGFHAGVGRGGVQLGDVHAGRAQGRKQQGTDQEQFFKIHLLNEINGYDGWKQHYKRFEKEQKQYCESI